MSNLRSPWRIAGDDLLTDDEWHDITEVKAVMSVHVPAGKALRVNQRMNEWARMANGRGNISPTPPSDESMIASGRRSITTQCIYNALRGGRWERDGDMVRRRQT